MGSRKAIAGRCLGTDPGEPINQVLADLIRRRAAGEEVHDEDVTTSHPELMPELGEKLHALRRVELAELVAGSGQSHAPPIPNDRHGLAVNRRFLDQLPGYRVVAEIHRGGQGVVYRATQTSTGRDIAIKVMREGPAHGPRDRARFEREVRILAQLRHPNIVTIHDSGVASGCSYFVMDFIEGLPLDAYAVGTSLPLAKALDLFATICRAVNRAHLCGVIHRDLKPSNIRVDRHGQPHILDFGLAKFAEDCTPEGVSPEAVTLTGQFVGSLPWASPEQAEGPSERVDVRTDVYSLGVIMFQVLTGQFPYPVAGSMTDVLRHIVATPPRRPRSLGNNLDEDVEAIVLKCLAKEPERRYQSAAAIAEDVERYLTGQPIVARLPSTAYQLKKLVGRHKLPFGLLVTLLVLVAGFAIWMSAMYAKASSDRDRATRAEMDANVQRTEAEEAAALAGAINEFLINDMLASAQPEVALGRKITVEEVLENASQRIDSAFADQPDTEASVRVAIGRAYLNLGLYTKAEEHLRSAAKIKADQLGELHPDTLQTRVYVVQALRCAGRMPEAEGLAETTFEQCTAALGEEHPATLEAAFQYALVLWQVGRIAESVELHRQTRERRERILGDDHPATLASLNQWALRGLVPPHDTAEAEPIFHKALGDCRRILGDEHPDTLRAMANLGNILTHQRRLDEAEDLLRVAFAGHRTVLGPEHLDTLAVAAKLAVCLKEQDKLDEADSLLRNTADASERLLGPDHPATLDALGLLGTTLVRHDKPDEAAALYDEIVERSIRLYGRENFNTIDVTSDRALALGNLGRYDEAEYAHRQALSAYTNLPGISYANRPGDLRKLIQMLSLQDRKDEIRPLAGQLLDIRRQAAECENADAYQLNCYARTLLTIEPTDLRDPQLALEFALLALERSPDEYHYNRYTVAIAYEATGDLDQAITMLWRALDHTPIEHSTERSLYEATLVGFLEQAGDEQAAEQVYRDTLAARREHFGRGHLDVAVSLADLAGILLRHDHHEEAEVRARECLEIRQAALPPHHAHVGQAIALLGESLTKQEKFEKAEPLLLGWHDQLLHMNDPPPERFNGALQALVSLYEAWLRPEQAEHYRRMSVAPRP